MIEKLKGFRDFYPEDMEIREEIFSKMRKKAKIFGFRPIDYPSLELLEMFRIKSGDEILSQTYSFKDRGDREITLIPEATPSTVRMLVARKDLPRPVRWYNIPKLWRYEEPQSGRTREHMQMNADIFGDDSPEADADTIGLACSILDSLGLRGSYEVRVNERGIMEHILKSIGSKDIKNDLATIDRFHKMKREDIVERLVSSGIKEQKAILLCEFVEKSYTIEEAEQIIVQKFNPGNITDLMGRIKETFRILKENGFENIVYNPSTVRGLAYYTGIVFEGFDREGKFRSIFGGGRYNNLSALFSGMEIPAVGFGMGDAVLENLMREKGLWKNTENERRYYIIGLDEKGREESVRVAFRLRQRDVQCVAHSGGKNLSNALKNATRLNFTHTILIGKNEMDNGKYTVRDLASGDQKSMEMDQIG